LDKDKEVDDCSSVSSFKSYKTVDSNRNSKQGIYKRTEKKKEMDEIIVEEDGSEDDGVMLTQKDFFSSSQAN